MKSKVLQWEYDAEGILELVRHLQCFPLAVLMAAERAWIDKTVTPGTYLNNLRRAGSKRSKGQRVREEYPECFPDVEKLLLDTLPQSNQAHAEDAGQALRKLVLLDTEAIPLDLLCANERNAVILLQQHSLVTINDTGCTAMHAVTQPVVRSWLTPKAQRPVLVSALAVVLALKPLKFNNEKPVTYFIGYRYAWHADVVAARAHEWGILLVAQPCLARGDVGVYAGLAGGNVDIAVLENITVMCQRAGFFFHHVSAQPREVMRMLETALDSAVALHGNHHPIVAAGYSNIGKVYQAQGEYNEALVEHQKSLEIDICVFGCEHVNVASSYNNFCIVYKAQGDYETALLQDQKSLEIRIRVHKQEHPLVADSYHNIGVAYQAQGKDKEALELFHKSLEIYIQVYGHDYPQISDSYHYIRIVYQKQGKNKEALAQYQKSLDINIRVYGQEYPLVADSKYCMGRVYESCNKVDKAREVFGECQLIYSMASAN